MAPQRRFSAIINTFECQFVISGQAVHANMFHIVKERVSMYGDPIPGFGG